MYNYLALGDSYTIGEGVDSTSSFPYLLVDALNQKGIAYNNPTIIATTGWTTNELIDAIKERQPHHDYDLVSLLIGVNNQYRNYPLTQYELEFQDLLSQSIAFARGLKDKVCVLSIPDWGLTSFGLQSDRDKHLITQEIDAYNQMAAHICQNQGIHFIDITKFTRNLTNYTEPLAADGLHYAKEMHASWVNQTLPFLEAIHSK